MQHHLTLFPSLPFSLYLRHCFCSESEQPDGNKVNSIRNSRTVWKFKIWMPANFKFFAALEPWFRHCFFSALGYGSKVIFYGCLRHGSGFIFRVALTMAQASFIGVYEPWMRLHL